MGLMRRAIIHGIETTNDQERPATGGATDADDYIMDFDINPLSESAEHKLRMSLQVNGGLPLGHPHHPGQQQSAGATNGGGNGAINVGGGGGAGNAGHSHHAHQQLINGNPHVIEDQGPRSESNGGHHPGMAIYSNLTIANRQHLIQVKQLPSTPPATPPEGSPTQYHTGSPHFQRAPPVGGHTPQCDHDGGRGNMVEDIGMWGHGGVGSESYNMNQEPIPISPINLSQNCPAGIENMSWMQKPEHQLIHGGVGSPQPYNIPHAHGHGPPHHAHMHHHHAHTRSHTRSQSLESTRDSSTFSTGSNGPPTRGNNPIEIPDEVLISKPVRELNKVLHGFPREVIVKIKQKRRTLKNRGYAQNCRTKRMHQKSLLEDQNKKLQKDIIKLTQERDMWKSKATELHRRFQHLDIAAAAAAAGNNHNGPIHPHNGPANNSNAGLNSAHLHHNNGQLSANQQQQHPLPSITVPASSTNNPSGGNNGANGRLGGNMDSGMYSAETSTTSSPDSSYY